MAAYQSQCEIRGLWFGSTCSHLEQHANASPRQADMHGVCIRHDISHSFESVEPAYPPVSFLFQNDCSPCKCKRPPLFDAETLLLLRRGQGLLERQIDIAGMKEMVLNGCPIAVDKGVGDSDEARLLNVKGARNRCLRLGFADEAGDPFIPENLQ